jgi:hypothetical protein
MTPQANKRREGGLTSYSGHSQQFRYFTWKELETARPAQKLLGAPTNGGGKCPGRGWWWRELKEANKSPMLAVIHKNGTKNGQFPHFLA